MSREFIENRIDTAHDMIDQGGFEEAVNLLKNLKLRIHEDAASKEINEFEKNHDEMLRRRLNEIEATNKDPLVKAREENSQWSSYAKSYLSFYSKVTRNFDVL